MCIKRTRLTLSTLFVSLLYLQRFIKAYPNIQPLAGSEFRVFTVSLVLANKFVDDHTFTAKAWAEVTGLPLSDIVVMEREFLEALGWKLRVAGSEYTKWVRCLDRFRNKQMTTTPIPLQDTSAQEAARRRAMYGSKRTYSQVWTGSSVDLATQLSTCECNDCQETVLANAQQQLLSLLQQQQHVLPSLGGGKRRRTQNHQYAVIDNTVVDSVAWHLSKCQISGMMVTPSVVKPPTPAALDYSIGWMFGGTLTSDFLA
jgi:hypothetical protein